nr:uncharacterized protein LOC123774698 [Procambarus clarkii]
MDSFRTFSQVRLKEGGAQLTAVNGQHFDVLGKCILTFNIEKDKPCIHECTVVDNVTFPGDILLGMDFLKRFTYSLTSEKGARHSRLQLGSVSFPVKLTDHPPIIASIQRAPKYVNLPKQLFKSLQDPDKKTCRLHAVHRQVCPPRSFKFIKVAVGRNIQPGSTLQVAGRIDKLMIPYTLVSVHDKGAIIPVVNLSHKPYRFRVGDSLTQGIVVNLKEIIESDTTQTSTVAAQCSALNVREEESHSKIGKETPLSPQDKEMVDKLITALDLTHMSPAERKQVREVLRKFPRLFATEDEEIGYLPQVEHTIPTGDNPPAQTRQWRLPEQAKQLIRDECRKMMRQGVIEESTSPWLSPVVLVRKPDGSYRFCVDYRKVNEVTTADAYPLPLIQEIIDQFGTAKYFSTLDAKSAYWAIPVAKQDREKTAFSDGVRTYHFKRMPFGLKTAPSSFQRAINYILSPVLAISTSTIPLPLPSLYFYQPSTSTSTSPLSLPALYLYFYKSSISTSPLPLLLAALYL